jgi:hypothetical protein
MAIVIQKVVDVCVKDILVDWHPSLGFGVIPRSAIYLSLDNFLVKSMFFLGHF